MQILLLIIILYLITKKRPPKNTKKKDIKWQNNPPIHIDHKEPTFEKWKEDKKKEEYRNTPPKHGEKSPTGWIFNANTNRWDPPGSDQVAKGQPANSVYRYTTHEQTKINPTPQTTLQYDNQWKGRQWAYEPNQQGTTKPQKQEHPSNSAAYQATNILTQNERNNYKVLKQAADQKGYIICPKVRLADIITPRRDANYMSYFGKIKSKHIDFVVYDSEMQELKILIELDDNSHARPDRQERDRFVDAAVQEAGYKIIHTRQIKSDILDGI